MNRAAVQHWVDSYEQVWRTAGVELLADLFTPDVVYRPSPWAEPVEGLDALAVFWDAERDGADEVFMMSSDVVAVEAGTAVVRVGVDYGRQEPGRWRNLWVLGFATDGRCVAFEEWPFAPDQPDGH